MACFQCYNIIKYQTTLQGGNSMKIDRLIGILSILLQKDTITAPELARQFEVSRLAEISMNSAGQVSR